MSEEVSPLRVDVRTESNHSSQVCESEREVIWAALETICASQWFRNTKRCKDLLEYVVGETLAGRGSELTERKIGVLVFARAPDYDTNDDSVVRTSALEVRKRLAQYYNGLEHETTVRIELSPGSYEPEFRQCERVPLAVEPARRALGAESEINTVRVVKSNRPVLWAAGLLALLCFIGGVAWLLRPVDPVTAFWGPIYKGAHGVIVAVGAGQMNAQQGASEPKDNDPSTLDVVHTDRAGFADAVVLAKVTALLESRGARVDLRRASSVTLDDLRKMPAVFVGNSAWTERLNTGLRFQLRRDSVAGTLEIVDSYGGRTTPWKIRYLDPYLERSQDWAVITRFRDPRTQQITLLLCGLGRDGTAGAGELVSQPKLLETLIRQAPPGWERKNFQAVIGVDLLHGNSGPPHVLATYFW